MKPKFYKVLETAIEDGVRYGYSRAFKHQDNPSPDEITHHVLTAVMSSINEWFDMEESSEDKY